MQAHERLREARERGGFAKASDAARAFGWPVSTYLGHENGSRGLTKDAAERYARAFGVSWSWLLGADEPPGKRELKFALDEAHKSEDEVGQALLATALMEVALDDALLRILPGDPVENRKDFIGHGPTKKSLSSRITLAKVTGLLREQEASDLEAMMEVRDIAQTVQGTSLLDHGRASELVSKVVSRLADEMVAGRSSRQTQMLLFSILASSLSLLLATSRTQAAAELRRMAGELEEGAATGERDPATQKLRETR